MNCGEFSIAVTRRLYWICSECLSATTSPSIGGCGRTFATNSPRSMNRIRLASGAAVGRRGQDVDRGSLVSVATPMLSLQGKFNVIY